MYSWEKYLLELQKQHASWMKLGKDCTGDGLADATEMMQKRYPGPYTVFERFDPNRGCFTLDLQFDSDEEKTFWLLKYQ